MTFNTGAKKNNFAIKSSPLLEENIEEQLALLDSCYLELTRHYVEMVDFKKNVGSMDNKVYNSKSEAMYILLLNTYDSHKKIGRIPGLLSDIDNTINRLQNLETTNVNLRQKTIQKIQLVQTKLNNEYKNINTLINEIIELEKKRNDIQALSYRR